MACFYVGYGGGWQWDARAAAYTPGGHRLRSVGNIADTKLGGAVKGATLLQLASLSADVSQGPPGVYAAARAGYWLALKVGVGVGVWGIGSVCFCAFVLEFCEGLV